LAARYHFPAASDVRGQAIKPRVRRLDLAFDFPGLEMRDRVVLLVIARRANGTGSFFQAQSRLAYEAGCGVRTVRTALRSLSDRGLIKKVRGKPGRTTDTPGSAGLSGTPCRV
jgi:hypothetical protein